MGQRTPTETLFGIVAAFVESRTWTQAELARRLETTTETIRKRCVELQAAGLGLEREEDSPHVYWSVRKDWFPGVLPFKEDEVPDLLRLLGRMDASELRDRVLAIVMSRLSNVAHPAPETERERTTEDDETRWLSAVEDAVAKKQTLRMQYYSASRRHLGRRAVSVHVVEHGRRSQFIATCHASGELRRFRVANVSEARLDPGEPSRTVTPEAITQFRKESFGGFRYAGASVACHFFVRDPESSWVAKNLPDERIQVENVPGGVRFSIDTTAVAILARFVVGLGEAARAETPELAGCVTSLARGALASLAT